LLCLVKNILEQLFRHSLTPLRRGRAYGFDFDVLRVECFEGTTPCQGTGIPYDPKGTDLSQSTTGRRLC
jgi:hypothetical protein